MPLGFISARDLEICVKKERDVAQESKTKKKLLKP